MRLPLLLSRVFLSVAHHRPLPAPACLRCAQLPRPKSWTGGRTTLLMASPMLGKGLLVCQGALILRCVWGAGARGRGCSARAGKRTLSMHSSGAADRPRGQWVCAVGPQAQRTQRHGGAGVDAAWGCRCCSAVEMVALSDAACMRLRGAGQPACMHACTQQPHALPLGVPLQQLILPWPFKSHPHRHPRTPQGGVDALHAPGHVPRPRARHRAVD